MQPRAGTCLCGVVSHMKDLSLLLSLRGRNHCALSLGETLPPLARIVSSLPHPLSSSVIPLPPPAVASSGWTRPSTAAIAAIAEGVEASSPGREGACHTAREARSLLWFLGHSPLPGTVGVFGTRPRRSPLQSSKKYSYLGRPCCRFFPFQLPKKVAP
ncbi:hypothetical protein BC939DRAFT_449040 [Gamsiella multidivaricata]|uniref:uncharacterized protein n=1 Tax=Gamsiella multidivaricata TaxID=101098 RepID=UPI0022209018|nr:uncharacterized protein BC939DRAFT_449040 [Gamsiella multidivaricata]KAI7825218.1 hypothetical protein BC939DRAFT_449040 [Gamsiella multidivaricata]